MNENKDLKDIEVLLCEEIRLLVAGEIKLISILPGLINNTQDIETKTLLSAKLELTDIHYQRLEKVVKYLEIYPDETFITVRASATETENTLALDNAANSDTILISTTARIFDKKIAGYATAAQQAEELKFYYVAELLNQTLEEETDTKLIVPGAPVMASGNTAIAA